MIMKTSRANTMLKFSLSVISMFKLAWDVQPLLFSSISLINLVSGIVPLISAWIIKVIFDLLVLSIQSHQSINYSNLILLLAAQVVLEILSTIMRLGQNYFRAELERKLDLRIQSVLYEKINSLNGLAPFEDPVFYNLISLGSQGAQQGPSQILNTLELFQQSGTTLISFGVVLLSFSPMLAGIIFLATAPQIYIQLKMGYQRFDLALLNNPHLRQNAYYSDLLSNVHFAKEMRLFDVTDYFLKKFLRIFNHIQQLRRNQQQSELRWQFGLNSIETLISRGAFIVVTIAAFAGRLGVGDITLYMSAIQSVQGALSSIIFGFSSLNESVLFYSCFTDLMALPQPLPVVDPPHPLPSLTSQIEFRNVSFRYSDQLPWILRDVNLIIPAGRCLSLVGPNGAGKTTLVKLITRLYDPTEGQILWDGVDIREVDPTELRHHISAILQDYVRYEFSAYENIAIGDITKFNEESHVHSAATQAGIHHKITNLPQGYQTLLSRWLGGDDLGVDLSGGEWQGIALARMFMRRADLFILDEPTAALDAQSEFNLYSHYAQLIRGRTSIIISHRFSTVKMADLIAVLDNGKIIEYGSHQDLIALNGNYATLYKLQSGLYTDDSVSKIAGSPL